MTADHSDCLAENPATPVFSRTAGTVAYESVVDGRHAETDLDGDTAWYKVSPCGIEGWIRDDHVKKCSPYDCPGFKVAKEDEPDKVLATLFPLTSVASDRKVDYDKLPPFFKQLFDEIDTEAESKGVITPREMKAALKKPAIAYKLSRLVCYHQSEWCADEMTTSYWQAIMNSIGPARADNLTVRVKNVCWWNAVSHRTSRFPSRSVYHWNPVKFIEQMKQLNQFRWAKTPFAELLARVESNGDYSAYNQIHKANGAKTVKSFFNTELTGLTIAEIQQRQTDSSKLFAAGKFQLIPDTLSAAVEHLGIGRDEQFTEEVQDRIFDDFLIRVKRPQIIAFLEGDGDIEEAIYVWAQEFASAGVRAGRPISKNRVAEGGESYYAGDGLNKSAITPDEMVDALRKSKAMSR